ncbi:RHS repeat domain-containing protein, partial [Xenorhabdus doucetiae]|uniref:RHS repeat domain-containing protein n=1 Tax=Xenorhabdus doucetiae TaxID=351671 RepID=UPI002B40DF21
WRYRWDTQNQLTHCETPDGSRWHYCYDAFGRRIRKLKVHDGKLTAANLQRWLDGKPDLTPRATAIYGQDYLWSGDQLIEETPVYADGSLALDSRVRWLYEPGALTPSARFEKGKLHYIVGDHQGTVREMLNENGTLVWAQRLSTWGKAEKSQVIASNNPDYHVGCNFRFCGQYEDEESGLYYNRFRYYNPETAQYISADPIGLLGGFNPYSYVHNPTNRIDPLGLNAELIATQEKINSILREHLPEIRKIDPNAEIGYRGSAASGISKAHDPSIARPVNLKSFDVDAFIQSDYLASDTKFTNRRRDANQFPEIAKIEQEIDKKLRAAIPGLRSEPFGFRIFYTYELQDFKRRIDDKQIIISCK